MNRNPKRRCLLFITIICILFPFCAANAMDATELSGFSALRNDEKNLLKPIDSSAEKVAVPKTTAVTKPVAEKEEVAGGEEEAAGLKTAPESKEILHPPLKPVIKRKTEEAITLPEESEFFLKLSKEEETLPGIAVVKRQKPAIISPAPPMNVPGRASTVKKIEKPKVIKVIEEEKKEVQVATPVIRTITQVAPVVVKEKKKGIVWKDTSPILRRGLIISGLASMLLIFLIVYLWQKGSPLPEEMITEEVPAGKTVTEKNKFLDNEIREIKIGYRGLEKLIGDVEKKLVLIAPLKGAAIDEFLNNTVREVVRPIEGGIKSLQTTCQGLEKMFNEFDKRLSPLNALKGLSIKELTYQTGLELVKPIEGEIKQLKTTYDKLIEDVEQRIDAEMEQKIDAVQKKNKGLEKTIDNIDNRLVSLDSLVSSFSLFEGSQPGGKTQAKEQIKPETEEKNKNTREYLYSQIYKMSDEGLSIDEIAQQTKMGKGEVRLILGLRKK